jgi:hypothetical protein
MGTQVLRSENATPRVAAKFYKAVGQAVLLYGSKTWNLTKAVLAWLEGFHVQAAYPVAQVHQQSGWPGTDGYTQRCLTS